MELAYFQPRHYVARHTKSVIDSVERNKKDGYLDILLLVYVQHEAPPSYLGSN